MAEDELAVQRADVEREPSFALVRREWRHALCCYGNSWQGKWRIAIDGWVVADQDAGAFGEIYSSGGVAQAEGVRASGGNLLSRACR
jgi:hypothetical protein